MYPCNLKRRKSRNPTAHTLATLDPANRCAENRSLIYRHLSSPDSDYLPALSPICLEFKDQQTSNTALDTTHISYRDSHTNTSEKVLMFYSQIIYTPRKHRHCLSNTNSHKTQESDCSQVRVPSPSLLAFCSMNSTTYQTQRKITNIARLSTTEFFTLFISSVSLPP